MVLQQFFSNAVFLKKCNVYECLIVNVYETAVWHINPCFEDFTNLFFKSNYMLRFLKCMSDKYEQMHS